MTSTTTLQAFSDEDLVEMYEELCAEEVRRFDAKIGDADVKPLTDSVMAELIKRNLA